MTIRTLSFPSWLLLIFAGLCLSPAFAESTGTFTYQNAGESYSYSVRQTGDNYTYEFDKNPGKEGRKIQAVLHVLLSVYGDDSINPSYSETFMKETALCFVFDGSFHSYRACFLPNDYSPANKDRFWGFVSRLPNAKWLIVYNLLPALAVFGGVFLYPRLRQGRGPRDS